jgi:hypothetical protein
MKRKFKRRVQQPRYFAMSPEHASNEPGRLPMLKNLGGAATAIASVLGVLFLLFPNLRPEGNPEELSAEISDLKTEHSILLEQYLKRSGLSTSDYTVRELQTTGIIIYFTVVAHGFRERTLSSQWSIFDAKTQRQIAEEGFSNRPGPEFTPEARRDRAGSDIWVPIPPREGTFYIRLELRDDQKVRLAYKDSDMIAVRATSIEDLTNENREFIELNKKEHNSLAATR